MSNIKIQDGISLVEVMVSLVISLFLLGGIVQVYVGNKATFTFTNAIAEIQENGRFALDTMSQDLRLASEWGCIEFDPTDTTNINNQLSAANVTGTFDTDFHDFLNEEAIEGLNENLGLNGSDTITIRGGKPGQANVQNPFSSAANNDLVVNDNGNIRANDFVLVARCGSNDLLLPQEADILQVDSVDNTIPKGSELSFNGNKSQQFENDAMVIELQTVTYWIGNSTLVTAGAPVPTLMRTEFGVNQELIEGVQDMQILYGVDLDLVSDNYPDQYLPSDKVTTWERVVSVRVMLLLQSSDQFVTDAPQPYTFNGTLTTPTDRRIRQVFTTTIALRNRIGTE
jgi:type IV pilus assembly protein PilW